MTVRFRPFDPARDFTRVSGLLLEHYRPGNRDGNWLQPIWEYAYTHPWFDDDAVDRIGIWEDGGEIVAAVHYELRLGEAFFETRPDYSHLKEAMLEHAEASLFSTDQQGKRTLKVDVNDSDPDFEQIVQSRGYRLDPDSRRTMSTFEIPEAFPKIHVPDGFALRSLAEDNDLRKLDRVLHRGFNHAGEPPEDGIEGRRRMQSGPNYRRDLAIVAEAPNGEFVSFAGLWFVPQHRYAYVEPVATDPDYRRRGLGRAVVLEGIRRCGELGATVAYVGTDMPFYLSFGFRPQFVCRCWTRDLGD